MTDHSTLRAIAQAVIGPHRGEADDRYFEAIKPEVVIALLDELEVLRAQSKPVKLKRNDYPAEFIAAMGAMERVGLKWLAGATMPSAFKAWQARMKAGASPDEILAGADKYARYCKATDRRTMMAQTFFGPQELFTADWTLPKQSVGRGEKFHFEGADRSGDQLAQAASVERHNIVIPEGEIPF